MSKIMMLRNLLSRSGIIFTILGYEDRWNFISEIEIELSLSDCEERT